MRLFVALFLPQPLRQTLAELERGCRGSAAEVRWTKPENIHLTLKFLGEESQQRIEEIVQVLRSAIEGREQFTAEVKGVTIFPSLSRPRVVVANLASGGERVNLLAERIESALAEIKVDREERKFLPHVTIGRVRSTRGIADLQKRLEKWKEAAFGEWKISEVCLMESFLKPDAAVYRVVERFPLKEEG